MKRLIRQVALASQRITAAPAPGTGAATPSATAGPCSVSSRSGLTSWLLGPFEPLPVAHGGLPIASLRGLSTRAPGTPDTDAHASTGPTSDPTTPTNPTSSGGSPTDAAPSRPQVGTRAKPARHHHARPLSAGPLLPAGMRGAFKDKGSAKVPVSAKAAAAMAAAKSGGQQPLPREARVQLDAQLAEMPLPPPAGAGAAYKGTRTAGVAEGPCTVHVTGFYIGHPFTRSSAESVAARLRNQPLAPGVAVAGVYHDHEDALITLAHTTTHHHHNNHHPHEPIVPPPHYPTPAATAATTGAPAAAMDTADLAAAGASASPGLVSRNETGGPAHGAEPAAAEAALGLALGPNGGGGGENGGGGGGPTSSVRQITYCMAVMLLEYGGVVFFNVPKLLHAEALAAVAAAALPYDAKLPLAESAVPLPLPRQPPLLTGSRADAEAWRQAVADKLSLHKEEQLIVVDPVAVAGGQGSRRWIRKLDDSLHIWSWDSTNLDSIARVLSQSAAIRYYNGECEDMLERYETILPLGYEPPDRLSASDRLLFWRSRLPLRDLRQMVFKSSGIRVRLDSRLGLRDPPSGTWESARHHAVWEAMRREFELDERRDELMEKTDLLKQSCLDLISANNESFTKRSELSIILLISFEILISLTDMHSALSAENVGRALGWALRGLGLGGGGGDVVE